MGSKTRYVPTATQAKNYIAGKKRKFGPPGC